MIKKRKSKGALSQMIASTSKADVEKMSNRLLLASKIGSALKNAGISQKRFSEMMNRTESEVSSWLSGDRNFTVDTLTEISIALNITLLDTSLHTMYSIPAHILLPVKETKKSIAITSSSTWNYSMGYIDCRAKNKKVM
jgi:DNA-binding helix-turn-helix protein